MSRGSLEHSQALWNRTHLDLASDEILAQFLDRGEIESWREIYRLAKDSPDLRRRIHRVVRSVPLPYPHFWLAALVTLGEPVAYDTALPDYGEANI